MHSSSQLLGHSTSTFQELAQGRNLAANPWIAWESTQEITYENTHSVDWSFGNFEPFPEYPLWMERSVYPMDAGLVDKPSLPYSTIPGLSQRPQNTGTEQTAFSSADGPPGSITSVSPISQTANGSPLSNISSSNHVQSGLVIDQSYSTGIAMSIITPPGRFLCEYHGCVKHFSRAKDRDRHAAKHVAPKFPCIFRGCHRKGAMAFYRRDKLLNHVRRMHGSEV